MPEYLYSFYENWPNGRTILIGADNITEAVQYFIQSQEYFITNTDYMLQEILVDGTEYIIQFVDRSPSVLQFIVKERRIVHGVLV